ncbi:GGDEF domain-containing protein [Qipengyuania sp. 1NDH17]|uniref:diguanylate cyclase n=1 Tax=Qipengyuania polymorpha TaxID=2867234 RepID=A0ABS7IYN7_9SPHN|nr:GGDEF domain-containing protein [Qipengyuania polymorpha]MBX7457180.1 GGDEF domain-containing protein [Qipengyuania polymorpha]
MDGTAQRASTGVPAIERDEGWYAERRTEILRSMAEVERHTLATNIVGTAVIIAFSQLLPNAQSFLLPAILRFVAIGLTSLVYVRIRARLATGASIDGVYRACILVGTLAGASWAYLILPLFLEPTFHPAAFLVLAGALIATSLVITNTSSLPQIWVAFCASFLLVFWFGMAGAPEEFRMPVLFGITVILLAVAAFAIGAARNRIFAAGMLVDNRRLGEDLAEALAEAEFLAKRDPLTGLYNRRAMFEGDTMSEMDRHLLLIDIDNFKQVNDLYGHDMGDRVLIRIGQVLRDTLREIGGHGHKAARLGGEEFAVVLCIADEQEADFVAEKLRAAIAELADEFDMAERLGTASVGISTFAGDERISDALQRADNALYAAKAAGRNTVRRFTS